MRICAVTGSRADWGLLRPVLARLRDADVKVSIVATGSHLSDDFGNTASCIGDDGFEIDCRVPLDHHGDDRHSVSLRMAEAISGVSQCLTELQPELLLILGDRYEIFAAAQAALIAGIPIAHIAGGDISEGAYDDAIRHAITKLSHLHFATNHPARQRILHMGEPPDRVVNTGSPGIDAIIEAPRWSRAELERALNFQLLDRNLAITFHPATLDPTPTDEQLAAFLDALANLANTTGLIFTGANADHGGKAINRQIQDFATRHSNACFTVSLGQQGYFSLIAQADLVVGNSSSGLYEAPSLQTPTLDIGLRQQGRLRGPSVFHVDNNSAAITTEIERLLKDPPTDFTSPYGDGTASRRIVDALLAIRRPQDLLVKRFQGNLGQ